MGTEQNGLGTDIPDSVCAYNRSVATHFLYILPEIMCSLSGIASVAVLTYSFFLYGFRLLFHHNAKTQWLGGLFVLFSILSAMLTIEWTLWNENASEPMTHCLTYSASVSIGERMFIVFYGILAVDLCILVVFLGLYWNNKQKVLSAGLNKKYQQHENLVVLRALFPMVVLNTIFVSAYILLAVIVRGFRNSMTLTNYKLFAINTFIFPYVSLLLSVTILLTTRSEFRRRKQRKEETNGKVNSQAYFTMYNSQWSTVSRDKKYCC
ncbi:unnamed protein product [Caenorhabditis sp. 36 PRJEB53466]|nr:unnamed protein product [Caenorhabditis sp. 36 PRJEB53466]